MYFLNVYHLTIKKEYRHINISSVWHRLDAWDIGMSL